MANPYAASTSAGAIMANVRGDLGDDGGPNGRLDENALSTQEVTRRILAYTRPHRVSLVASFLASAVSVVLQLYVPIVVGRAIDCMVAAGDVDFPALVALLQQLALVVVAAAVTQWLSGYCTNRLTYETIRDLRIDAFARFRDLPLSFVDAHSHGDLLSRVVNDADQVGDGLLQGLTQLFTGVVTIVGTLAFMFSISVPVGLVVVIVTPISMLVAWLIARYSAQSFKDQQALQGALGGYVEEMVGSQKLVCAFAFGDRAQAGFDDVNQRLQGVGERAQFTSSLSNPATRLVNNITYAVVAVVGCVCVISGWPSVLTVQRDLERSHADPDRLRLCPATLHAHRCACPEPGSLRARGRRGPQGRLGVLARGLLLRSRAPAPARHLVRHRARPDHRARWPYGMRQDHPHQPSASLL